jgi:hypothetical protein
MTYCKWCGNNVVQDCEIPCDACNACLTGKLKRAHAFFTEASQRYGVCCSGLVTRGEAHLHLHSDDFDSTFGPPELSTSVEAGLSFFERCVETYWLFDGQSTSESCTFGDHINYRDDETFWGEVHVQVRQGAEAAWENNVLSCRVCSYHHSAEEICCTEEKGE